MMAPKLSVLDVEMLERDVSLRLPFRFGVITLQQAPQAFIRCRIRHEDGREAWGLSAEMMVPKWFDKRPGLSNEDNLNHLRNTLRLYREAVLGAGHNTAFGHFASAYRDHLIACKKLNMNALTAGYGPALIDRAVFDALCRLENLSFADAVHADLAGLDPGVLLDEFNGFDMPAFLQTLRPSSSIHARHTVGLIDPLTASDQPTSERVGDGLPETLQEIVSAYGHRYFKLKVGGDVAADLDRLRGISAVLDGLSDRYFITLDGNEQYSNGEEVLALLSAIDAEPSLRRLSQSILFIEQPIARASALNSDVRVLSQRHPVIIDESDEDLDAFNQARQVGYSGISSKNCKGFYKSLINRARCEIWSEADRKSYFMSAEDLTCQAGVCVQQDLALVTLLGLDHVERNGHHYVNGMAGANADEQRRFLDAHSDLYTEVDGRTCMKIVNGQLSIGSLQTAGFGSAAEPDWDNMIEMDPRVDAPGPGKGPQ